MDWDNFFNRLDPTKVVIAFAFAATILLAVDVLHDGPGDSVLRIGVHTEPETGQNLQPATIGDHIVSPGLHCPEDNAMAIMRGENDQYRVMCVSLERIRENK